MKAASLPPDTASEGISQSTEVPGCTVVGAKKKELINLILKQIYKIVSGFSGSQEKWLLGELAAAVGGGGQGGRRLGPHSPFPAPPDGAPASLHCPSLFFRKQNPNIGQGQLHPVIEIILRYRVFPACWTPNIR